MRKIYSSDTTERTFWTFHGAHTPLFRTAQASFYFGLLAYHPQLMPVFSLLEEIRCWLVQTTHSLLSNGKKVPSQVPPTSSQMGRFSKVRPPLEILCEDIDRAMECNPHPAVMGLAESPIESSARNGRFGGKFRARERSCFLGCKLLSLFSGCVL